MCAHQVVRHDRGLVCAAVAGREHTVHVAAVGHHPGLVQRGPQRHAVVERFVDRAGVVSEPVCDVGVEPAAAVVQRRRQVPVIERGHRRDAGTQQLVDESFVEAEAGRIDTPAAIGHHATPGDAETVRCVAEIAHQSHVVAHALVVVAGDIAGVAVAHAARCAHESVPDAGPGAIGQRRALDLVGRGGAAPKKATGELSGHGECGGWSPCKRFHDFMGSTLRLSTG